MKQHFASLRFIVFLASYLGKLRNHINKLAIKMEIIEFMSSKSNGTFMKANCIGNHTTKGFFERSINTYCVPSGMETRGNTSKSCVVKVLAST